MAKIIINASISGGIIILLWYLVYPVCKKVFNASWHYGVLKTAMFFMLFPVGMFIPVFNKVIGSMNTSLSENSLQPIPAEIINGKPININIPDLNISFSPEQTEVLNNIITWFIYIWLTVIAALITVNICGWYKFNKAILRNSKNVTDLETYGLFLKCKKNVGVRGKVAFKSCECIKTPLVTGILKPIVILPDTEMNLEEKYLALMHELTHIKNGDLWFKFFAMLITVIHWFNPLSHLLCKKIYIISEEYCDEQVVKTLKKEERILYGNLILKTAVNFSAPGIYMPLSQNQKNIKRRLLSMMKYKKSNRGIVCLSSIFMLIFISVSLIFIMGISNTFFDVIMFAEEQILIYPNINNQNKIEDIAIPYYNNSKNQEYQILSTYEVILRDRQVNDISINSGDLIVFNPEMYLNENQKVSLTFDINLSEIYSDKENGEPVTVGYILNGEAINIYTGKTGNKKLELEFCPPADGEYLFYLGNISVSVQNYNLINILKTKE